MPISSTSALLGTQVFLQSFFYDSSLPSSFVHTNGLQLNFVSSFSKQVEVVYDRQAYQQYVTSPQVGRAVWNAIAVPGFTYVNTIQFTCGRESHWMVIVRHVLTNMEFCLIPGGSFRMGDITGTWGSGELPVHWVHVEPYLLAQTEVTQGQFTAIMGTSPWQNQPDVMTGPNYAASYIDWNDAAAFCAKTGLRLPSEAEWEYACRAGTVTCYHYGENCPPTAALGNYAWYAQNTAVVNQRYAHQVGKKLPNAFGLYDMHGNVAEWCEDSFQYANTFPSYNCAPSDGSAWIGGSGYRVVRGGCWLNNARPCRSPSRGGCPPRLRSSYRGFRPARPLR